MHALPRLAALVAQFPAMSGIATHMHQRPREWRQWFERDSTADAALAYPEPWSARLSASSRSEVGPIAHKPDPWR